MNPHRALIARIRAEEVVFRQSGYYEAAVSAQRKADYLEAGGALEGGFCSYIDRGIGEKLEFFQWDDWLQVYAPSGAIALAFTKDRAHALFWLLLEHLDITPAELVDIALHLVQAGMPIRKP